MTDREKVIKGMECHQHPFGCNDCPYWDKSQPLKDCDVDQLAADALALLKEQEPEPAVPYNYLDAIGIVYGFKCPKCNSEIHEFQQYCDACGKAVKWDA